MVRWVGDGGSSKGASRLRRISDTDYSGAFGDFPDLRVQVGQGTTKHLLVSRFVGGRELLLDPFPRERQALDLLFLANLGGRQFWLRGTPLRTGLRLLFLHGFAFPSPSHAFIVRPKAGVGVAVHSHRSLYECGTTGAG